MRERNPYECGPLMCSECGHFEAIDTLWIASEEAGMMRQVAPCHECIGQFQGGSAEGKASHPSGFKKAS